MNVASMYTSERPSGKNGKAMCHNTILIVHNSE